MLDHQSVQQANEDDVRIILGWLEREYREDGEGFWSNRRAISRSFEEGDLWVIREDGDAIAFQIGDYGTDVVCVREDPRRHGYGRVGRILARPSHQRRRERPSWGMFIGRLISLLAEDSCTSPGSYVTVFTGNKGGRMLHLILSVVFALLLSGPALAMSCLTVANHMVANDPETLSQAVRILVVDKDEVAFKNMLADGRIGNLKGGVRVYYVSSSRSFRGYKDFQEFRVAGTTETFWTTSAGLECKPR